MDKVQHQSVDFFAGNLAIKLALRLEHCQRKELEVSAIQVFETSLFATQLEMNSDTRFPTICVCRSTPEFPTDPIGLFELSDDCPKYDGTTENLRDNRDSDSA